MKQFLASLMTILVAFVPELARAGAGPWPVETEMDFADTVVVGKLVAIETIASTEPDYFIRGRATIAVRETLKGEPSFQVRCEVFIAVNPHPRGTQEPSTYPTFHKVGDEGIWIIQKDGRLAYQRGFLPLEQVSKAKDGLALLKARKWSEPVNGLRAWAAVVEEPWGSGWPLIMFAVQNCSDKAVSYPRAINKGILVLTVTDEKGVAKNLNLDDDQLDMDTVGCRKIKPNEILYMATGGWPENWAGIELRHAKDLPAGKYTAIVTLQNHKEADPIVGEKVEAWKGSVSANPVAIVIPEKKKKE